MLKLFFTQINPQQWKDGKLLYIPIHHSIHTPITHILKHLHMREKYILWFKCGSLMMNEFEIGSIREKNVCDSIKLNPKPLQM
jgi:hypothetical protein